MLNRHLSATRHTLMLVLVLASWCIPPAATASSHREAYCLFEQSTGSPPSVPELYVWMPAPGEYVNTGPGMFESNELECGLQGDLKSFGNVLGQVVNGLPDIFRTEGIGEHTIEGGTAIGCGLELIDVSGTAITDINVLPDFQFEGWAINCYLQFTNGTVILSADSITNCVTNPQACMGGGSEPEPDSDGDGFPDASDNCPDVPNNQADSDNDGIGDACDNHFYPEPEKTVIIVYTAEELAQALETWGQRDDYGRTEIRLFNVVPIEQVSQDLVSTPENGELTIKGVGARRGLQFSGPGRFVRIAPETTVRLENVEISGASASGNGGGIFVQSGGRLYVSNSHFTFNEATGDGGAIHVQLDVSAVDNAPVVEIGCTEDAGVGEPCCLFEGNSASKGGALSLDVDGDGLVDDVPIDPFIRVSGCTFTDNTASEAGCDLYVEAPSCSESSACTSFENNHFSSTCGTSLTVIEAGNPMFIGNSWWDVDDNPAGWTIRIDPPEPGSPPPTTIMDEIKQDLVIAQQASLDSGARKLSQSSSACSPDTVLNSMGYNISTDTSCGFDHATDLENADPMKGPPDANGIRAPLAGSPLIDHGPSELIQFDGALWPSLPCGFRDIYGLGRPQDGDGDGEYECDIGAVEFPGPGAIVPGHSGAFIDPLLDGEGQFVQIIDENTAAIFTFTYRMDGSGPAWFLGVADIVGNSLVVNDLLRPVGTSFGDDFDAGDVWLTPAGGMSMIFSSCESQNVPGRAVYSGSPALGYPPLISEAQRLTGYVACADGGLAPSPNAALSGPFGDPLRNGEGLVIQWLPGGVVAAVFFTYDFENNQMWVVASGIAEGKTAEMGAFYPTSFPAWGSEPNPANVQITPWGSFTLEYIDCDTVRFTYISTVPGFGSGEYILKRIAALAGTECPEF